MLFILRERERKEHAYESKWRRGKEEGERESQVISTPSTEPDAEFDPITPTS